MATKKKKKKKKKQSRSKRPVGKQARTKKLSKKRAIPKKKSAKKKPAPRKAAVKTKVVGKKKIGAKAVSVPIRRARGASQIADTAAFSREKSRARSGGESGDLQGLSRIAGADSESVDELLEEGNAFEADAVAGVEEAGNDDEREVHTHEVPEDDVPGEYLDED